MAVNPGKAAELERKLEVLREGFLAQLPVRLAAINTQWQSFSRSGDHGHLITLHRLVHSLTGTAGTFGLVELSRISRQLEQVLKPLASGGQEADAIVRNDIDAMLVQLARGILPAQSPAEGAWSSPAVSAAILDESPASTLLLLSRDELVREELSGQTGLFGYQLQVADTPDDLSARLATSGAASVIIDTEHDAQLLQDSETMARIQAACADVTPIMVVARTDALEERIQAVRAGARAYLLKPFTVSDLVDHLDQLTAGRDPEPYRILVVGDDPAQAERYTRLLEKAGMEVHSLPRVMDAMSALVKLQPDLILMDLHMPECSATELARAIRQQEAYENLPIVFLSSATDMGKQFDAVSLGGDDFIDRAMADQYLVRTVGSRAVRSRRLRSLMARDSLTGLLRHSGITEALDAELSRARRQGFTLSYVLLDVDHFRHINDSCGHMAGDRALKSLACLLRQRFRKTDFIGRYGGEEFAIVMPATEATAAFRMVDEVRKDFAKIRHHWQGVEFHCSFSAGIAGSDTCPTALDLGKAADKALHQAKGAGRNRVQMDSARR